MKLTDELKSETKHGNGFRVKILVLGFTFTSVLKNLDADRSCVGLDFHSSLLLRQNKPSCWNIR